MAQKIENEGKKMSKRKKKREKKSKEKINMKQNDQNRNQMNEQKIENYWRLAFVEQTTQQWSIEYFGHFCRDPRRLIPLANQIKSILPIFTR